MLLTQLGFQVILLSAEVAKEDCTFGREFGHLTLLVKDSDNWLADVGFGDSFIDPLKLENGKEYRQLEQRYKLVNDSEYWTLYQYKEDWKPQYRFKLIPRELANFQAGCLYNKTHPQSIFKQRLICTIASENGRTTLSDRKLIITQDWQRKEKIIENEAEYKQVLNNYFQIDLNLYSQLNRKYLFDFIFSK